MTNQEYLIVHNHIKSLIGGRHGCALKASEISREELRRGLRVGDLCDDCILSIKVEMDAIEDEISKQ